MTNNKTVSIMYYDEITREWVVDTLETDEEGEVSGLSTPDDQNTSRQSRAYF